MIQANVESANVSLRKSKLQHARIYAYNTIACVFKVRTGWMF